MNAKFTPAKRLVETSEIVKSGETIYTIASQSLREIIKNWIEMKIDIHLSTIIVEDDEEVFKLYYYFINRTNNDKIVLLTKLDRENPEIESIDDLINAIFYEGESTEMFGIKFTNNPIDQVFLPEDWNYGNPLRKDWVDPRKDDEDEQ